MSAGNFREKSRYFSERICQGRKEIHSMGGEGSPYRYCPEDWTQPDSWAPNILERDGIFWPRPCLVGAPKDPQVVKELTESIATYGAKTWDPLLLAERLNIPVRFTELHAAEGGLEAFLMPSYEPNRFEILCDPWVEPGDEIRVRFRVAHELAHTFFFAWGNPGTAPLRTGWFGTEEQEEKFCDEFAAGLLSHAPVSPSTKLLETI